MAILKKIKVFLSSVSIILSIGSFVLMIFLLTYFDTCNKNTSGIPGDMRQYDPIKNLPKIQQFAGKDVKLANIKAVYVKSDGTMDIKAKYSPNVTYLFVKKINEIIDKDVPIGVKDKRTINTVEEITIKVTKPYYYTNLANDSTHRFPGMERYARKTSNNYEKLIADTPKIGFDKIWEMALKQDVPENAVAMIEYDNKGYHFYIDDTNIDLYFDINGGLINKN